MPFRRSRNHIPMFRDFSSTFSEVEPLVKLWILRTLITLKVHRAFICRHGFADDDVARALGLHDVLETIDTDEDYQFSPQQMLRRIKKMHSDAERNVEQMTLPESLAHNIDQITRLTGMSEVDGQLLAFTILLHSNAGLRDALRLLGDVPSRQVADILSVLLDLDASDILESLSRKGVLARAGLLSLETNGNNDVGSKLTVISDRFADKLLTAPQSADDLLNSMVQPSQGSSLTLDDYPHVRDDIVTLRAILAEALASNRRGCNVLLYGPTGSGKTELVRAIADSLGHQLYDITCEDEQGDPAVGSERLRSFQAAQAFFGKQRALILFDEVEDVFRDIDSRGSTAQRSKGYTNLLLEGNLLPTVWVSNHIRCMDPAFIRRFDMAMELPIPPRSQRERMIERACSTLELDVDRKRRMSQSDDLSPAIMERAARTAKTIDVEDSQRASVFERLVNGTLKAQQRNEIPRKDNSGLPGHYNPSFVNARDNGLPIDLSDMAEKIIQTGQARLCLYGPPGTGKTAYGRWLAQQADRPFMVKKASDLMDKFVGGTEQLIAQTFREAEEEGAILLIDEMDTFLQDRRKATHSWEVSHVNEMLTQMESFEGILIASTNLMEGLDQAALRRFDFKAKFDYLLPEQAWQLFVKQCQVLGMEKPDEALRASLDKLPVLTPGDFAAVSRRSRFRPIGDAEMLMMALSGECRSKEDAPHRSIGFM